MWIVHRENKKDVWNQRFVSFRTLLSHLTRPPLPHRKHSKVVKSSPFVCKLFQRREKTGESSKPSLCQCRKTELKKKKRKKKIRQPPRCLSPSLPTSVGPLTTKELRADARAARGARESGLQRDGGAWGTRGVGQRQPCEQEL